MLLRVHDKMVEMASIMPATAADDEAGLAVEGDGEGEAGVGVGLGKSSAISTANLAGIASLVVVVAISYVPTGGLDPRPSETEITTKVFAASVQVEGNVMATELGALSFVQDMSSQPTCAALALPVASLNGHSEIPELMMISFDSPSVLGEENRSEKAVSCSRGLRLLNVNTVVGELGELWTIGMSAKSGAVSVEVTVLNV